MRLILIRHGKAGDPEAWEKQGKDDAQRPLTPAGKKEMRAAAKGLRRLVGHFDALITSPLKRAVKTADIVFTAYDDKPQFLEAPVLATGPALKVLAFLRDHELDSAKSTVALVGHDPHLANWVGFFLIGKEKPLVKFKKGSVAILDFPESLAPGKGTLYGFYHPGDLARLA